MSESSNRKWLCSVITLYKLQGSLVEVTNQKFSLKYQMFQQLAAAFISTSIDEGSSKLPKRVVFQRKSLVGDFRKKTLSDVTGQASSTVQTCCT